MLQFKDPDECGHTAVFTRSDISLPLLSLVEIFIPRVFEFFGFPDYCWDNVEDGLLEALKLEGIGISWSDKSFRNSNSDEEREFQEAQAAVQGAQALVLAFRNIALHGGMKRLLVHVECVMKIASLKAGTLGDTMLF